jgi:hypothetical protein
VAGGDQCTQQTFVETGNIEDWVFVVGTTLLTEGDEDRELVLGIFDEFGGPPVGGMVAPATTAGFFLFDVLEAAYELAGGDPEAITSDVVRQAVMEYNGPLALSGGSFDCPGPEPFVSLCNQAATVVQLKGDKFVSVSDWYEMDLTQYASILEG